jgi:hypothetical protein
MFDDLGLYLLFLAVGFVWGWFAREQQAVKRIKQMVEEDPKNSIEKLEKLNLIPIKIEQHNNTYYVYSVKDRTFMAQGETKDILEDNLAKRYPGKKFAALPENLKEIGFDHEPL